MTKQGRTIGALLWFLVCGALALPAAADEAADKEKEKAAEAAKAVEAHKAAPKPKFPPYADVLKDAKSIDGLIKLHHKGNQVYAELSSSQLDRDFIVLISIARGIGEAELGLISGMSWGFGDDWLWQFRRVDDNIHIVRRNVRFKAASGSPEERAVKLAYTDSVLFSLPIATIGPSGGLVVDLTPVFMSDLPQISHSLHGFSFASNKSNWAEVKGLPENVELEVAATYASGGSFNIDTVPDSRGATINVHYSISLLPQTGYQPRMADDRVGHFLTAIKDFSKKSDEDRFVRYINRWDLQKAEPSAELSPPKRPIVFWIEKTVPYKFRKPISDGILEWNKAFEKAGFVNAIEVHQQMDKDDTDPENINFNFFRWITAGAGFAMGPSRVNPATGQILDADIIFDADFIQFWKREYENFTPASIAAMTGGAVDVREYEQEVARIPPHLRHGYMCRCELHHGMAREFALGSIAMLARGLGPEQAKEQEKLIMQGLKEVTMHEVGHTLGLRHNFKASSTMSLADVNNPEKTKGVGLTSSVMDYTPANIVGKDFKQSNYYSDTIGPYDMWAIEYAYKPQSGGTDGEVVELKKIASRAAEPLLAYATDEDTRGIDPDPLSNRFDLGSDPIEYAKDRTKLIAELWPGLVDRITENGDGYERARQAFGVLLGNYGRAVFFASRYIGGINVNRDHKGDPNGRAPFVVVPAAKQREALSLLETHVFSDKPFSFPPELYNHLASTRWAHWGVDFPSRPDYAVHDVIAMWQDRMLFRMLAPVTLRRLHDTELEVPSDQDALTTAELLTRLTSAIFAEVDSLPQGEYSNRKPAIASLRRNLQRLYLKRLAAIAMRTEIPLPPGPVDFSNFAFLQGSIPEDCQTVAYAELITLHDKIKKVLDNNPKLDAYSRAHLLETSERIQKVVDARLVTTRP
jgi:Met-zincin/Domain of unknown function (DUF5117)/Domain of unknown function (DUF5118)